MELEKTLIKSSDRLIAIGDIHGQYDLLLLLMKEIKFNKKKDILVFLGDYIDRGKGIRDERKVVEHLINLRKENPKRVILLKGNHEDMAELAITNKDKPELDYDYWWQRNGSAKWMKGEISWLLEFCQSLPLFLETQTHFFVHAGALSEFHPSEQDSGNLLWERYGNQTKCLGKQLVVGHTPRDEILIDEDRICVDTGAFYKGKLSAYDVMNNQSYEVEREK